jgi:hypothetical protein
MVSLAVVASVSLVVVKVSVVKVVDVDGTVLVDTFEVQVRVDTAVQDVVKRVSVTG